MQENSILKHVTKVNKIINWAFFILCIIMTVTSIATKSISSNSFSLIVTIGSAIGALILRRKHKEIIASYVLVASAVIQIVPIIIMVGDDSFILTMFPILVAALYFDQWIYIAVGTIMNATLIIVQITIQHLDLRLVVVPGIFHILLTLMVLILVKAGRKLIIDADEKGNHSQKYLDELQETIRIIKENTSDLNNDIFKCDEDLGVVREISSSITSATQEITSGIVGQNQSVTEINQMIKEADRKISELKDFSTQMENVSANASLVVTEGSEKINTMDAQMAIINQAVTKSLDTVQELNDNMDEINNFLSGITQIARQTNLLALNAAIEAARAGESGKGFAIVADEIRKLAEQSANTVNQVNQIINQIREKTENVLAEVSSGQVATRDGAKVVNSVNQSFEKIQESFKDIDRYIVDEISRITNIADLFSNIDKEVDSIASISEGQSAATEELLATIEEHNENITDMYNLMQNIKSSSDNLQVIIK